MMLGDLESYMPPKMKLDHQLMPYTKINSRWIKDLNASCDTMKVLGENIHRKISEIPCSNIFTNIGERDIKERINKWEFIKIRNFCTAKENITKWKGNQLYGKIYLPMIPQTRVRPPKYIRNSHDSTPGRQTIQLKNGPEQTFLQGGPNDIWKDAQHHYPWERCKLKPQSDTTSHLPKMAIIHKSKNKCWQGCGEKGTLVYCW